MAILRNLGVTALALLASFTQAEEKSVEQTIADALRAAQPTLVLMSAKQIPGQDLYEVELTSGEILYSTSDGQYFVYGSLFQATQGELVNITAKRSDEKRLALVDLLVVTTDRVVLGQVDHLFNNGANDVLVVKATKDSIDGRERLLPYSDDCVQNIDLEKGMIEVDWDPEF